ncbi:MAG: hypothetical protein LHV69_10100 [Elusimicrobia bacterium]|nr:hypothetical protein [Candidatus Obscuribacterium magneticum]
MPLSTELTLQDYWRIIHRRKMALILVWGTTLLATMIFTAMQTPIYQAEGTVRIEPTASIPGMNTVNQWDIWALINTEVKSIRSSKVSERAAILLGDIAENAPQENRFRAANEIQSQIKADRVGDSNLLKLSGTSDNPTRAAAVVNAMMEAYIQKGMEERNRKARESREFTEQEMTKAETKLRTAEDNLKLSSEKSGAKGIGGYLTSQFVNLQEKLQELRRSYTETHPEVVRIKSQIEIVEGQIRELPEEEIELQRLTREVRINEELYTFLSKKFKEAQIEESQKEQYAFIDSPAMVPQTPIRPNKGMNMSIGLLAGLFFGITIALILENLDTSIGTIEDVEQQIGLPVLAVVPHIPTSKTVRRKIPLTPFHFMKPATVEDNRMRLAFYHPPTSSFIEAYHTLRTNLRMPLERTANKPGAAVAFTSAGVSEGKTLTAVNFALTAAQSGLKTMLIEADTRRPTAHKLLGVSREPGLTDCILGNSNWQISRGTTDFLLGDLDIDKILKSPGIENFRFLPCGRSPLNPADVLGSPKMERFLRELRTHFDLLVLDCPPVMLFADTLLIGPKMSGMILVYQAGRTARGALKRAKDQLLNVKSNVIGVILNNLHSTEMEPHYGSYYYNYKYYSHESEDNAKV